MPKVSINKPHHRQERSASCLPACAKMMLNFFGNAIEEKTLRDLLATDDYGTSALNILMLNASLPDTKAEVHIWMLEDLLNYLQDRQQPCIVTLGTTNMPHWDDPYNLHAVVAHELRTKTKTAFARIIRTSAVFSSTYLSLSA